MTNSTIKNAFAEYYGYTEGGVNLLQGLKDLPISETEQLHLAIKNRKEGSKVFFMGNGGSFDNARLLANLCRKAGIAATTPGECDDYPITTATMGYDFIFSEGLKQDLVNDKDIIVGISGSGNSPNILNALELAKEKQAQIFCMGGRDGGKMRLICGDQNSLIAKNECMEAIEDLHVFMMLAILIAEKESVSCKEAISILIKATESFMTEKNLEGLTKLGTGMLNSINNNGRMFVLGTGIGANHFRADMGRGATNTIPARGLACPECFTVNSGQATANDDGSDFIIIDGLVKYDVNSSDYALLCDVNKQPALFEHCSDLLEQANAEYSLIGRDIIIDAFAEYDLEFVIAMLGHSCGEVIRRTLQSIFIVRELDINVDFPEGQKKLGRASTIKLEEKLRMAKVLKENEVVTFCYGKIFAVDSDKSDLARCYY